jgi:PIN domain nuclease of toxin-antitoxin system
VSLILDTHILLWWLKDVPGKLSKTQKQALEEISVRGEPAAVSVISLWELAMLLQRGRVAITESLDEWMRDVESHPLLMILPLTASIAIESVRLGPDFNRDPADQIIVATARCHGLTLVTADERIRKWGKVKVI